MTQIIKSLLTLIVILTSHVAMATSVHPCTPMVQAKPTRIQCLQEGKQYSILIETLMSKPLEMCQGKNYFENKTAKIEISSADSNSVQGQMTLFNGSFEYRLIPGGQATFHSEILDLDLKNCVTPQNGGAFSIGN